MGDSISVLILDDDDSFRQRARTWLQAEADLVVSEAPEGSEAIALTREARPDVILLGVNASRSDGLQTLEQLCALSPRIKILVLDDGRAERLALEAFRKGALGYLSKEVRPDEIVAAIRTVARGKAVLSPSAAGQILDEILKSRDIA